MITHDTRAGISLNNGFACSHPPGLLDLLISSKIIYQEHGGKRQAQKSHIMKKSK
jgi:hypothetical protein